MTCGVVQELVRPHMSKPVDVHFHVRYDDTYLPPTTCLLTQHGHAAESSGVAALPFM